MCLLHTFAVISVVLTRTIEIKGNPTIPTVNAAKYPKYSNTLLDKTVVNFLEKCEFKSSTEMRNVDRLCSTYFEMIEKLNLTQSEKFTKNTEVKQVLNDENPDRDLCLKLQNVIPANSSSHTLFKDRNCFLRCYNLTESDKLVTKPICRLILSGFTEIQAQNSKAVSVDKMKDTISIDESITSGEQNVNDKEEVIKQNSDTAIKENVPVKENSEEYKVHPQILLNNKSNEIKKELSEVDKLKPPQLEKIKEHEKVPASPTNAAKLAESPQVISPPETLINDNQQQNVDETLKTTSIKTKIDIDGEADIDENQVDLTDENNKLGNYDEINDKKSGEDDGTKQIKNDNNKQSEMDNKIVDDEDDDDDDDGSDDQQDSQQKGYQESLSKKQMLQQPEDPFRTDTDSNFFTYFMFLMFACVIAYVVYHNKSKMLALMLEGRRTNGNGRSGSLLRRKHTAAYRRLDSNLEEAIMSSANGRSTQVIY